MKKNWRFFWTASAVFWAAVCLCAAFFGIWTAAAGAVAWAAALARFYSIRYEAGGGEITVTAGYLVKSTKIIKADNILYESRLAVGGHFICLRLHTASGGATLFCDPGGSF